MENNLSEILDKAILFAAYHAETKEELENLMRANGCEHFIDWKNGLCAVNEFGIFEGIGFHQNDCLVEGFSYKIWNNRKFGTYNKK